MAPKVGITQVQNYDEEKVLEALRKLKDATDFPAVKDKTILIKPNILSDSKPEKGITVHPTVVKGVIRILQEEGAKEIWVGESPAIPGSSFKGEVSGIAEVCRETGAKWVDFASETTTRRLWHGIKVSQTSYIDKCDLVFSLAKMKTHQLMYATGAVKNCFGTVPGLKSPLHLYARSPENFAKLILSIYRTHIPEYSVMDAIIAMEGTGPANGTIRPVGLLMASASALALDKAQAIIMGYDPKDIPILSEAERNEKGSTSGTYPLLKAEDLIIDDYERIPVKRRNLIQSLVLPTITGWFDKRKASRRPAPQFQEDKCRRCRKCMEICPAKALTMMDGKVTIDTKACIRCYCCHEVCPFDAILVDA